MEKSGFVYIMANKRNGTVYLGATSDLPKRAYEHRTGVGSKFTTRYGCKKLVWFEKFENLDAARHRELQMKEWKRAWKLREIEGLNPDWDDLFDGLSPQ